MQISRHVQRVQPSATMAISAKAAALRRQGVDVVALSAGEPDFDTPRHIKDAAIRAIEEGFTKYTMPSSGIVELKEAICRKFAADNGLQYSVDEVIVNNGAKHCLFLAVMALVNPGDEVIIPAPYWVTYVEQPRLVGGEPVIVPTSPASGLKLTPEELRRAITPRTRLLYLNTPANPSGMVYSREELAALAEVAVEHGVWVLSDEVYEKLVYDGAEHVSIASLGPEIRARTVVVNGVSKAYAMTGWRIGYAAGPAPVIAAMNKVQNHEVSHPASISQKAAVAALGGPQESIGQMRQAFDARRRYMVARLNALDGVSCRLPQGAFYAYPDVSALYGRRAGARAIADSVSLCEYLLDEAQVACVPGVGFGTQAHIRLSYATSMANIERAMDRIEAAVGRLR